MKCKKCGKKLRRNEMFCTMCGYYNDPSELTKETSTDDWSLEEEIDDDIDDKSEEKELDNILKNDEYEEVSDDEKFISAYMGDDYHNIHGHFFNIWAFLLNWIYFLYKKLLITGIIGIIITYIVIVFFREYVFIYAAIIIPLSGLLFNLYYRFIVKMKINKIKDDYDGSDDSAIEEVCREKGGSNYIYPLVIYFIFLVAVVISIIKIDVKETNTKFFKENSENKANCNHHLKSIYEEVSEKDKDSRVVEAVCKVVKNTAATKDYQLYLKAEKDNKIVYFYYKTNAGYMEYIGNTSELPELQNKTDLTEDEKIKKKELEMIKTDYDNYYKLSQEDDNLIKNNKNTSEKLQYVFSREEVVR